jgi:tRNA threonylcarbamoyladenosine biosynthesis protein TsaB
MRILAIDTTSEFGSLALHSEGTTLEEVPLRAPDGFSAVLFGYIDALLHRHDWTLESIDIFASAAGPGSFTGVRVGLTAAKGLSDAIGRGALAVSNLQALAECGSTSARGVVMDARRGEIYGAVYDSDLNLVSPEVVAPFQVWLESLGKSPDEIIAPDFSAFRASFGLDIPIREQRTLAAAIARIAERSQALDPAFLDANYVRRSDAELFWTDRSLIPSP